MNKIVPLILVLIIGEFIMRHVAPTTSLNPLLFIGILLFCLIFWRLILVIFQTICKIIAAIFFMGLFR
ncbi:hypothetical protein [Enterococcus faecium]|uniref:hypothetical protein n=1 Tax=Enterococcus faecium TaxID=1352 RepID=UPI000BF1EFFC|nr:hypothetical protein [Enterococcus faecium]PEH49557.1 hypothetical protein CRM75_01680 [Enterococcus faecium]